MINRGIYKILNLLVQITEISIGFVVYLPFFEETKYEHIRLYSTLLWCYLNNSISLMHTCERKYFIYIYRERFIIKYSAHFYLNDSHSLYLFLFVYAKESK
jgi:hypothetical protein